MVIDKKELRKEQYRSEILLSAEQVFARQGFHNTTMDEVAEECGWSKGTLYLYFNSKEDLFFSVINAKVDQFATTLTLALEAANDLEQVIRALVKAQLNFFIENNDFFQLVIAEQGKVMHSSSTGMRESMVEKQQRHIELTSLALGKYLAPDSPVRPDTLARSILGAINIHTLTWLLAPASIDPETLTGEITELFLNGVKPHA